MLYIFCDEKGTLPIRFQELLSIINVMCILAFLWTMSISPVIAIHGGAWAIPDHLAKASIEGVKTAARVGHEVLNKGGSAVDAVEAAVRSMENDPAFDAGKRLIIFLLAGGFVIPD